MLATLVLYWKIMEVTCEHRVVVSVPGKRFECKALMPDETVSTLHYLITGTDGTFEFGTEPPAGEALDAHDEPKGASPDSDH